MPRAVRPDRSINAEDYQHAPRPVAAMPKDYAPGEEIAPHSHRRAQLLYAVSGVMRITAEEMPAGQAAARPKGIWIVPPQRAVWIPSGCEHEVRMVGPVQMRTLYVEPDAAPGLPAQCRVIEVSGLLRELILALMDEPLDYAPDSRGAAVARLLLQELVAVEALPLHLPQPRDVRLQAVCRQIEARIGEELPLEDIARDAGMSSRTLARLFRRETGIGFQQWRQQARLAEALARLAAGQPVGIVATDLGYAGTAAFTAMFRRSLGTTPSRYFETRAPSPAARGRSR
ncbi:AraC family transcriptional regulator [Ferrovibrio xuzhouensis]|uniref:Helix-turn-helix domain-containing protein n=1 Tax=Ferrovibrio xuzhouensis TaxID=1576914 RepID=A0ABV7VGG7_9PROT